MTRKARARAFVQHYMNQPDVWNNPTVMEKALTELLEETAADAAVLCIEKTVPDVMAASKAELANAVLCASLRGISKVELTLKPEKVG